MDSGEFAEFTKIHLGIWHDYKEQINEIKLNVAHHSFFGKNYFRIEIDYTWIKFPPVFIRYQADYLSYYANEHTQNEVIGIYDCIYQLFIKEKAPICWHSHEILCSECFKKVGYAPNPYKFGLCDVHYNNIIRFEAQEIVNLRKIEYGNRIKKPSNNVYILKIKNTNRYKIGVTCDIKNRIANIQNASPFNVEKYYSNKTKKASYIEKFLHDKFKEKQINREWFELNEVDLVYCIDKINAK